jgi:type I restriction enzyme M protein
MIRTARVNMYLHGFKTPDIIEHDTLTSEDFWNDRYDVILANPPFMTPKGGIQPHKKFSVQANRSEVLFTDYIATHLKPRGRAGFIVPEGIIFQSGNAYKQLRKNLVEQNGLVAVISLPGGVFQPYSGVKTSILYLNPELARQRDSILFVKIENDGYSLGAQRRAIEANDLPDALEIIKEFAKSAVIASDSEAIQYQLVPKSEIAKNGEYNLSGDRYGKTEIQNSKFKKIKIGDIVNTVSPPIKIAKSGYQTTGKYPIIDQSQDFIAGYTDNENTILEKDEYVIFGDHTKVVKYVDFPFAQGADGIKILKPKENLIAEFLYYVMCKLQMPDKGYSRHWTIIKEIKIPLPPLSIQREIVEKIAVKQRAIEAARQVIDSLEKERKYFDPRPRTPHENWQFVKLGEVAEINDKTAEPTKLYGKNAEVSYIDISSVNNNFGGINKIHKIISDNAPSRARRIVNVGDTLLSTVRPNLRAFTFLKILPENPIASTGFAVLHSKNTKIITNEYLFLAISSLDAVNQMEGMMGKGAYPSINQTDVSNLKLLLPPLSVQQAYVAEFEREQAIAAANRELIGMMERKIENTLSELWEG